MAFVKIDRKFFTSNRYWNQQRDYSYAEAWIDLIQSARFEADPLRIVLPNGKTIKIERGEMHGSLRFLGDRWGWSKNKVSKFLKENIDDGAIALRNEGGESIIRLINYEKFNSGTLNGTPEGTVVDARNTRAKCGFLARDGTPEGTLNGTPAGQRRDSEGTNIKNLKNSKNLGEGESAPPQNFDSDSENTGADATEGQGDENISPFEMLREYWNLKAAKSTYVKMAPMTALIASPFIARELMCRIEEYGDENIIIAIDRIADADWWHENNKTLGVQTFLKDTIFPKFLNREYKNNKQR